MLSARGRQCGYRRAFARLRLIERGERPKCPLGAGFLHAVGGDKLLRQQRLEALQVLLGMLELRFQAGDLGVGHYRIHLFAVDLRRGGVELGLGLGHAGHSSGSAVLQAIDLFTGEGQRGPGALQRNLVRSRIDQEKKIAFLLPVGCHERAARRYDR